MKHVGRILLSTFFLILAVYMTGCAQQLDENSIPSAAGRFATVTNEYPGVVMVIAPQGRGMCTGTIVAENAVLTAAHCLLDSGTYTVRTKNGDFKTTNVQAHGTGDVDDVNDIGVLIFSSAITTNQDEIYPIAQTVAKGEAVAVVGYGCSSVEKRTGSGIKRAGTNRISEKDAYLVLLTPKTSNNRGIIGDASQAGTCFGDSGGPLFRSNGGKLEIAGVTHAGGTYSSYYVSEFVNVADNTSNRNFLRGIESSEKISIDGL